MSRPVHFEIPVDDPEAAIKFYEKIFDWKIEKWDGPIEYWIVKTGEGPGIDGGLLRRRDPEEPCVNTINVEDLDQSIEEVKDRGGELCVPKKAVPTIGWLAYCKDPDGNIFGMLQPDMDAK